MSTPSGCSLADLLAEARKLRDRLEGTLPSYRAALDRLSQIPQEFERRYWTSKVDLLVEKVNGAYERYQAEINKANLMGRFIHLAMDTVLRAGRLEPVRPPTPLEGCLAIWSSGRIEPTYRGAIRAQQNVALLTLEEFQQAALKLKEMILKGEVAVEAESEIPGLIRNLFLGSAEQSTEKENATKEDAEMRPTQRKADRNATQAKQRHLLLRGPNFVSGDGSVSFNPGPLACEASAHSTELTAPDRTYSSPKTPICKAIDFTPPQVPEWGITT